ncbi:MAG: apolipoprotein N-acyltransferase [Cellvibrionaceae bacterium]
MSEVSEHEGPIHADIVSGWAAARLLLALAYLFPSWFVLCWIAFVPLLVATDKATVAESYTYGLAAGLAFYMSAGHWIVDFLILFKGYDQAHGFAVAILFWIYCAQLPALLFASFTWLRRNLALPSLVLFPLLVVCFYTSFPMLFPVQLGESQSRFLPALQAIEWTGVHGLDFIIGLSNISLFYLLTWRNGLRSVPANGAAALTIALWLIYGLVTTPNWDRETAQWPRRAIGLVQPNEAPVPGEQKRVFPGYSWAYPHEMEMTERLVAAGAELVIWPEARYKRYFDDARVRDAFASEVARLGRPLMFQDLELGSDADRDAPKYNSVAFLQADGSHQGTYRKIHRVPFGETLPFAEGPGWANTLIKTYFGGFLREISAGDGPVVFSHDGLHIVPLVCYETLFPMFVAEALPAPAEGSLLVGVSNDSWFGSTRQPFQHVNASILRAVENRVPMVHVLNNGPSTAVAPNGRIVFQTKLDEAGGFIVDLPHATHSGGSFYSRHPTWFINTVYGVLAILLLAALSKRLRSSLSANRA